MKPETKGVFITLTGDATQPLLGDGMNMIIHVCNDRGGWGAGFVLALSRRWKSPERVYRDQLSWPLGTVTFGRADDEPRLFIANMVAQRGFRTRQQPVALDYDALDTCLQEVAYFIKARGLGLTDAERPRIHMPLLGCGLAGGSWDKVRPIIQRNLREAGFDCYLYLLPEA